MEPQTLESQIRLFDPSLPIAKAWMPPSSWYVSPEFYEFEQGAVFGKTWQPVARIDQFPEPGAYVAGCLGKEPWVVVRDQDGSLRAFHNTCRHKGREVVQGCGKADQLVCGYHAWTYQLDGRLKTAPKMAGIEDFHRDEMSLLPLPLETWGPWVFLNLAETAVAMTPRLGPLTQKLDATRWQELRYVSRAEWDIECNWKVYVDNYLDGGYHIPHMHPTLDAQLEMSSYHTELYDGYSIQTSGSATAADERIDYDAKERIGDAAFYVWIYPNFMLNRYGPCLDTNYVVPLGSDRCRVVYEFFFLETEGEEAKRFIEESVHQSAITQREDIAICESVQVGLKSSRYDRGRYAPKLESGEYQFHQLLARDYLAELTADAKAVARGRA